MFDWAFAERNLDESGSSTGVAEEHHETTAPQTA
jgi:hypothetical protein